MSMLAVIGVHFTNICYDICLMSVIKASRFCDRLLYYFIYLYFWVGMGLQIGNYTPVVCDIC
jgi:hypothetical protein